ncbi:MAG TPA: twin-arginine translocation signal domain-containing protein, partial [Ignavibacteria bacterium]|nr:twin-arginine translocation signal domain-containing protein [Ignavibacteria bacterium]
MKRRDFIKTIAVTGTGAALSVNSIPLNAFGFNKVLANLINPFIETDKVFVVIQLMGGNDGLNTVVPYQDSVYYTRRPVLGIPSNNVLTLPNTTMGLHPALTEIKNLFTDNKVAIVQNVGYPNSSLSHFRATDIWHTASNSNQYFTTGWLGRYLKEEYPNYPNVLPDDPMAIQI